MPRTMLFIQPCCGVFKGPVLCRKEREREKRGEMATLYRVYAKRLKGRKGMKRRNSNPIL